MREQLLDRMIKIYGFEHEIVIEFARMCEEWLPTENNDKALETLVKCHEENPVGFDDDEDLQDFIELELEQYANELGLEVEENDDAKTLWAKIQEKTEEQ